MPIYHKLVRDLIPGIIASTGKGYSTRTLTHEEFRIELRRKLEEEFAEYLKAENDNDALEELADMLEVIFALGESHGLSTEELEEIRNRKAKARGAFKNKLYLIEVEND